MHRADPPSLRILVVSHTHWDREWYHMASRFRQRLVALVDTLLDSPDDAPFLLDGQTIVLEDYLAVRPERASLLRERLASGAIEAGPWYVLADNLIAGGEAIVRNLGIGRLDLERLGMSAPRVAYCPDTFGHPAAMPLIAAGFGFPLAIVWRGLGGREHPRADTLWWQASNGDRVLVHHLPPDGYETGSALPTDASSAERRWRALGALLASRNSTGVVLLPNGADHHARQPDLSIALDRAASSIEPHVTIERTSLARAADAIAFAAAAAERTGEALPIVHGELRDSYGYTWTLQGTFATRAHQKRLNAILERALLHDVEPWIALATMRAAPTARTRADGQPGLAQLPSLLQHVWRTLLRTHPHDTLCGCSIDAVARAMDMAQEDVAAQCAGLRGVALSAVLAQDVVANRSRPPHENAPVLLRNRAARARCGVAEIRLVETVRDVPVGPGSADAAPPPERALSWPEATGSLQPGRVIMRHDRRESAQHYPDNDLVREHCALAWVNVPALGLQLHQASELAAGAAPPDDATLAVHGGTVSLRNALLRVQASTRGVDLSYGERVLRDCLRLESQEDGGDSYTPSLRGTAQRLDIVRVTPGARGPLRASCVVHWRLVEQGRTRVRVRCELQLDAGARVLHCRVTVKNRRPDHRLRLVWRTDVQGEGAESWADAAFGPVQRSHVHGPPDAMEIPPRTMPLHRWMSCTDAARGATVISDGLAEGEIEEGSLAVTLLRAIGELSRADLPERPGHAGWPAPIPMAQCIGTYHARFGLLLHDAWGTRTIDDIEHAADDVLLPLVGESLRDVHSAPAIVDGPSLSGEGLRASAVTLSRDGNAILLRVVNLTGQERLGAWTLPPGSEWRYAPCRIDETLLAAEQAVEYAAEPDDARMRTPRIDFRIRPRDVLTFRIVRDAG